MLTDTEIAVFELWHWEPMKHIAKRRHDVFISANTDDQTGGSVQDHLKSTDNL